MDDASPTKKPMSELGAILFDMGVAYMRSTQNRKEIHMPKKKPDYRSVTIFTPVELMEMSSDSCHATGRINEAKAEEAAEPQSVKLYRRVLQLQQRVLQVMLGDFKCDPDGLNEYLREYDRAVWNFFMARAIEEHEGQAVGDAPAYAPPVTA